MTLLRRFHARGGRRSGTTMFEFAVTFPAFAVVMFGMFEFGRAYMVTQTLNAAARQAARTGVTDNTTTADVDDLIKDVCQSGGIPLNKVRVYVMDGSPFDEDPNDPPKLSDMLSNYSQPYEIADAKARQLLIMRVEVNYNDVALLSPRWLNVTLYGQVVVRKE